ncbi:MAG: 3-dehydroquinate synthase [uncultured Rubrobacteraceae bacterium]|uniref:3-dehydroquinate synthase n=1 Tax=uncultured Rubrobacteraceae bacterium TaxID=349277 RepID=A0A6J4Q6Z8_9ACTN|nr:MAG: 3-dehydroquinate synthase [uncultured Rubrobacteraceae bacterium]
MSSVTVEATTPYEVWIEDALDLAGVVSDALSPGTAVVLTDSTVGQFYARSVEEALKSAGWNVIDTLTVPAGEASKSIFVYETVVRRLARSGLPRGGTLFALGGGVVGDLGGFVASSYMRGIDFVQLPTSLLAMVDSSVGGKVGLDLAEGKNLVGAFLQPRLVAADLGWLETLPPREVSQGLAEVVKMGLLAGGEFFEDLELLDAACSGERGAMQTLVLHSVRYKAAVVAQDEREAGLRAILNYGHTIGHGLEAAAGYNLPHGEAVAAGMLAAAHLGDERFHTDLSSTHEALLHAAGLPLKLPPVDIEQVLEAMGRDKKRRTSDRDGKYRFVLLRDPGRPERDISITVAEARRAIGAVLAR